MRGEEGQREQEQEGVNIRRGTNRIDFVRASVRISQQQNSRRTYISLQWLPNSQQQVTSQNAARRSNRRHENLPAAKRLTGLLYRSTCSSESLLSPRLFSNPVQVYSSANSNLRSPSTHDFEKMALKHFPPAGATAVPQQSKYGSTRSNHHLRGTQPSRSRF